MMILIYPFTYMICVCVCVYMCLYVKCKSRLKSSYIVDINDSKNLRLQRKLIIDGAIQINMIKLLTTETIIVAGNQVHKYIRNDCIFFYLLFLI